MKNAVTPQDFGAVGNGKADDTTAFQKAVDSGYDVFIPSSRKETYLITDTIRITNNQCKRIYGEPLSRMSDAGAIVANFSSKDNPKATALFDIHTCALRIAGLRFISKAVNSHRAGILINAMDESICDYDIRMDNCSIKNYYKVSCFTGRGLEFISNTIGSCNYLMELYWNDEADTNHNHPAEYDQRGIAVKNNRLHAITSGFITVKQGHAYGLHFNGNTVDNGKGYLIRSYGTAIGWNVSGNVIQGIRGAFPVIDFRKGMTNCIITGNTFLSDKGYWEGTTDTVDSWLKCAGDTTGSIINSNVFKNASKGFMTFNNINGTAIIGNVFHNQMKSSDKAVTIKGKSENTTITGNAILS